MRLEMSMKPETLLKLAAWFEARAKRTECRGCKRRALRLARVARRAAQAKFDEALNMVEEASGEKVQES